MKIHTLTAVTVCLKIDRVIHKFSLSIYSTTQSNTTTINATALTLCDH
ncbi:Uncharacterised protein [Acinetobacter calcoaceticus]|uniref:Uncharacterized protein n=1 Tax=Acinetobacter calcoaceticus TaxID=471 RepID=A0A446ZIN8_ACICA|nr:Uncharacterised protein [Acinetobacter calcoaceticus]